MESTGIPPEVPSDDGPAVPDEQWLIEHALPARVRHAPRLAAWVTAGVLTGLVVGTVLALLAIPGSGISPDQPGGVLPALGGYHGVTLVTALTCGVMGGLVGAALALWADRRSRR